MADASEFCRVCQEKLKTSAEQERKTCNECNGAIDKLVKKKVGFLSKEGEAD